MITSIVGSLIYSANRRVVLDVVHPSLRKLWNNWDLRVAVLISIFIQTLLTILGNRRKFCGKVWVRALVWSAYTAADSVTIFALGIISNKLSDALQENGSLDPNLQLTAIWTQFLFLHLGGPDSITAYALEDNALWMRQLLGLVSQTCGAVYVFLLASRGRSSGLSLLSILMFIAGFIKYGERTWTLKAASIQLNRNSVLKNVSIQHVGLNVLKNVDADYDREETKLLAAYGFLAATRRLFADASLMPLQSCVMKMVFKRLSAENAFRINEIQLGMIYDLLYSKGLLLFSRKGLPLRVITFFISCFSLVFFLALIDRKHEYSKIDLCITFALLIVAVLLELYAALNLLNSDWFFVWLAKMGVNISTSKPLYYFLPFRNPRWSNNIGQCTLLRFLYKEKSLPFLGMEKYNQWNTQVDKDLKDLIFKYFEERADELLSMSRIKEMPFTTLPTTMEKDEKLQEIEDSLSPEVIEEAEEQLNNTTEFEYKIVIWSIATEILYYLYKEKMPEDFRPKCKVIKRIARYLLYLLVKHPSMVSAQTDIMNPSFEVITIADFFQGANDDVLKSSKTEFCLQLLHRFRDKLHLTSSVEGIVIYKAMKIVKKKNEDLETKSAREIWKELGDFWVEMLAYSANRCTVNNHAQRLRYGGEFLTHVWLLVAHFGLTHHHFQSPTVEGLKFITSNQSHFSATKSEGLKFVSTSNDRWVTMEKRFEKLTASTNGFLPYFKFGECIGMQGDSKQFAWELCHSLARSYKINGNSIDKEQLRLFWNQISDQNFDVRLKTFICMIDKDSDGKITVNDILEIIRLSAVTNGIPDIRRNDVQYAALIMEVLGPSTDGYVEVERLENLLRQAPRKYERVFRKEYWTTVGSNPFRRWFQKIKLFCLNVWQRFWILLLWLGIVLGLFAYKFVQYRNKSVYGVMGNCVCVAKGAAETLKFNMALVLLPVCRNNINWFRNKTKLNRIVPSDNTLDFHMVISIGIAIGVLLHSGTHLICDFPRLIHATEEEYVPMKPYFGEKQPQDYLWFVKGVEGVTGIIMVVLMSVAYTLASPPIRRNKLKMPRLLRKLSGFNAFWYSHHFFIIIYVLLVVHGIQLYLVKTWYEKTIWMYLAVPVLFYTSERLIRKYGGIIKAGRLIKVAVYPGNALVLHLSKPPGFEYKSGQYLFLNCPSVSSSAWHPFYLTSAPGDDYLSFHIRAGDEWTSQLKFVFEEVCKNDASRVIRSFPKLPKVLIEGPYGAPTQEYKIYDVVLLWGLGIGITPMISILKDILNNVPTTESSLESVLESGNFDTTRFTFRTKKAYLYWLVRSDVSFTWLKELIDEIVNKDEKGVIEFHNHLTNVYEEGDARSTMISLLQSLVHDKSKVDVVSGTSIKSHFGSPNLYQVLENIAYRHRNLKIGVFYCGPSALTKEFKRIALEISENTSSELYFHNF